MDSRLDRLFSLLDSGTTAVTRKAAAQQIGEIQKYHPYTLYNLLERARIFLHNKNWDTRAAAGEAIECIANNVPLWRPSTEVSAMKEAEKKEESEEQTLFNFADFDIEKVMKRGAVLVASGGQEFDDDEAVDDKTRLANQRKQLKQKLGFTAQFSEDGLVEDDDLISMKSKEEIDRQRREEEEAKRKAEEMQAEMQLKGLSARQRIQAKRKLRQSGKGEPDPSRKKQKTEDTSDKKKLKTVVTAQPSTSDKVVVESVVDTERTFDDESEWPLERFCAELFVDLFDTRWEVRHGAAIGLRSVLKRHINSAGRRAETNLEDQMRDHLKWREDATIRCLCVLALDRFNDFLTDRAVAPVRETVAQVLAMLLRHVEKEEKTEIKYETKVKHEDESAHTWTDKQVYGPVVELVQKTLKSLYVLTHRATWEERLSGFLGIKYLMATRHDLVHELLPLVLPAVIQGIQDKEDDVRMVAAEALVPLISTISDRSSDTEIGALLAILWNTLLDLDDLTASTSSVMTLLAEFYSIPRVAAMQPAQLGTLDQLVPRLWPFFRHNVQSVRKCALQTLDKLLSLNQAAWSTWVPHLLNETLQILYQNVLLEPSEELVTDSQLVWQKILERIDPQLGVSATQALLGTWFKLLCTPRGVPFDRSVMLIVEHPSHKQHGVNTNQSTTQPSQQAGVIDNIEASTAIRVAAARTLAHLMKLYCHTEHAAVYINVVLEQLKANSASKRLSASMLIAEWTRLVTETARDQFPVPVRDQLLELLAVRNDSTLYYDEVLSLLTHLSNDCRVLVKSFQNIGVPVQSPIDLAPTSLISVELAAQLATAWYEQQIALVTEQSAAVKGQPTVRDKLEARRKRLITTMGHLESVQTELHISVLASLAAAVIALAQLPPKLNAIINPLMKSIKTEQEAPLQQRSGRALAQLMLLSARREPNPNTMITQNVIKALCAEGHHKLAALTRAAAPVPAVEGEDGDEKKKRGRKKESTEVKPDEDNAAVKEARLSVRGAQYTLQSLAEVFRSSLFTSLTRLWELMSAPFKSALMSAQISGDLDQQLIDALHVISTVIAHVDKTLWSEITELMKMMIQLIPKLSADTRELNAVALAHICHVLGVEAMKIVLDQLVPLLQHQTNIEARLGAAVALHHIIDRLGFDIVPYVIFLIIPIMGRMSDQSIQVRKTVTFSFATLIRLMPLERGIPDPQGFSEELIKQKQKERHFLEQLLDGNKLDNYDLPIKINGELRQYQQEGVNWMAFLNKYNLHGILCDDMGLGKTLQAICILASDDIERRRRYRETPSPECIPLPSLVICPPTLIGHWEDEVLRFCGPGTKTLQYLGPPAERARLRSIFNEHQFIIMSYDIVRNDIDNLEKLQFNYAVLDEGHIIKNAKTKITQSVKRIRAHHRLILSGTPIQNNVLELWSLFDFLMPGFLGDEKQFNDLYSKPILASRDAKASSKEQEAGELALEALHRQVLPFVLRRVKEDVLHDLPPKIIQDYHCELSPLQSRLYEDFSKTGMKREVEGEIKHDAESGQAEKSNHIFQALQYLRKLCSHPCLVLDENHPEYAPITHELQQSGSHMHDIQHAPKLLALKELLHECGIGVTSKTVQDKNELVESVVCQHRVLIFCQMKTMLDIIEQDLFKTHMPTVTYMRLDGTVPTNQRTQLVSRFNNDISIDCMLLTTAVGGLGLNLQTADTVIFVEHDWNPMKDLQAMDRAHRIGQKKTVNVYRLITRGTLEEKIMSLQKFKLNIANSVVNKDNQSFQSMDTSQLLDLFNYNNAAPNTQHKNETQDSELSAQTVNTATQGKGIGALLNSLGELWDESQYEEYDLNSFIKSLK